MSFYSNHFDIERSVIPHNYSNDVYYTFFSKDNINYMSSQITLRLKGVHPEGKNIIVSNEKIISVMDSIYKSTFKDVDKMTMMTISYIVDYISSEFQTEQQNNKLNIWVTNFPNEYQMQQIPQIKLREKRPTNTTWSYNY
jgi:hypothetical protein